ncbi:RNA-binding cell elongation regulator Jag/EloR [Alkaliphilus oremlandii]|uniref:RNA-binding protein KhpB n=1 Tax=Alkaliphilus oremlandii (strain OhILAs) TaxID=350688 RepID=A8MKS0_ALKOO|nr:RNA-binding cell elongation regulator Jag/EloR [Alkaliphilus oremlandii]ABW20402.1 single-stranded nucleic acid binding R3H domain protein [Alkaliphilus oremlandii OhILAs]
MKFIESMGKTVEEAIVLGLKELNKTREQVEVEVLELPTKGFLGILGSKLAKVKLTVLDRPEDSARVFLEDLFKAMDLEVKMAIQQKDDTLTINIEGPQMGVIIGRRGQTLDSLQYLVSLVVNKTSDKYVKVFVDTENYRQKREETLVRLAAKMAGKVRKVGKTIALEPMNPYERRIIHASLQSNPYIQTYSEGEEPFRKVVIALKK